MYSNAKRREVLKKAVLLDGKRELSALAKREDVSRSTLYRWVDSHRTHGGVGKHRRRPRSSQDKLDLILEASRIDPEELGAFYRRAGIYASQLEQWRRDVLGALETRPKSEKSPEAQRIRALEKEVLRKDRALAETAAILVLRKKAEALWEDEDDFTPEGNDN